MSPSRFGRCLLPVVALVCLLLPSCDDVKTTKHYRDGLVVSASEATSRIGADIIGKQNGNAFDAAVAVAFALAVVHPEAGNIGGGGFAVTYHADSALVRALDFRETAPSAATETMYLDTAGEVIEEASTYGARASGVPGTVAGLWELHRSYGSLAWDSLLMPAIALADTGFVVDEYLHESLNKNREKLSGFEASARVFLPGGTVPRVGDRMKLGDLRVTLQALADNGSQAFYQGEIAEKIVRTMDQHGGLISREDLAAYRPHWREPLSFHFDSCMVYSMPPPSSGGVCMAQILKLLEPWSLDDGKPSSPEYMHLFAEASRLAFADRSRHLGDPGFAAVPTEQLYSDDYLDIRRKLIDPGHATPSEHILPGEPLAVESEQTTHFCIADGNGNLVSLTYTLNTAYGSKLVVDGAGFLLNNEMDDFSIKPGHPNVYGLVGGEANKIEPGKRMLSSMSPTIVFEIRQGREFPYIVLGSPGGSKIITTVAQAILDVTRFDMSAEQTVAQPRFHHQWLPDALYLEQGGYDINVKQELIRMGHNVREREPYGDLQMILLQSEIGLMSGASDPRGNGAVIGVGY
jgi:gamma-glutamyltranspeptidase/glutathione hydrolase